MSDKQLTWLAGKEPAVIPTPIEVVNVGQLIAVLQTVDPLTPVRSGYRLGMVVSSTLYQPLPMGRDIPTTMICSYPEGDVKLYCHAAVKLTSPEDIEEDKDEEDWDEDEEDEASF